MLLSMENGTARRRSGDEGAVDMLKEAGFTGIDYSLSTAESWYENADSTERLRRAKELRRYAEERGMCFSQAHAPYKFRYGMNMDTDEAEYGRIVRSMETAAALGSPMIVVHSVVPTDGSDHLEYNLRWYRSLLPYAEKIGIRIGVENLLGREEATNRITTRNLGTAEAFCRIQDRLNSPLIAGCLDLGHANLTSGDTPAFIRRSAGHVQYLHIHDNNGTEDMHQLPALARWIGGDRVKNAAPVEKGGPYFTQPWDEILKALADIRYDGPFNLELVRYTPNFTTEQLPLALKLAAEVGKTMMRQLEVYREER